MKSDYLELAALTGADEVEHLEITCVGVGDVLYTVTEPDALGWKAYIAPVDYVDALRYPDTEEIHINMFPPRCMEPLPTVVVHGRAGLVSWYVENVGHDPNEGGHVKTLELLARVASHLILRAKAADDLSQEAT